MSSPLTVSWSSTSPRTQKMAPWIVCFAAALFFFFEFVQLNAFNALTPHLMQSFNVGAEKIGVLSAYYFYANVLFLLVAGAILDRFSTRRVILYAMSLCVVCTFLFSLTTQLWQAEVCRFLTGAGGSFCFLSSVRLATRWFLPKRMALVIGSVVTIAMLGGVVAQAPFTFLTDHLGWRYALMLDAVFGVVVLAIIYVLVSDFPPGQASRFYQEHDAISQQGLWLSLRSALFNLQNWLAGIYTSMMNLPIFLLGAIWGGLFLVQVHHLSRGDASLVTTMVFLGTIVGSPLLGWLSDRIRRRCLPMLIFAILSLLTVLVLIYVPNLSFLELAVIFFVLGFFTSAQIISYPLIAESNPRPIIGTAEGLASVLIMSGGMLQPVFGKLMTLHWDHKIANGVPTYMASDYHLALMMLPVAFVISFACVFFMKETRCKTEESYLCDSDEEGATTAA